MHHMYEVMKNPLLLWKWVHIGRLKDTPSNERDRLLMEAMNGFSSALDGPVNIFYRDLARLYPDSKIILTTRDPEEWYASAKETIFLHSVGSSPSFGLRLLYTINPFGIAFQEMLGSVFADVTPYPANKTDTISRYQDWVATVKQTIPKERLLEFSVTEGWGPLCEFLDVAQPQKEFPKSNSRLEFQNVLAIEEGLGWFTLLVYILLLGRLIKCLRHK